MAFNCPHCQAGIEDVIPKVRFDDINNARKEAQQQIEDLNSKLQAAAESTGDADSLRAQIAELGKQMETQGSAHSQELTLARAGITDPDDAADLLAIYARRGGEVPLTDWIGDRDSLPRAAAALFATSQPQPVATSAAAVDPAPTESSTPQPAPTPQPIANRGATGHPAGSQSFSSDQIAGMSVEEYRSNRAAILKSISGR